MRQLNIHNLRVSIDAFGNEPLAEAHRVIALLNEVLADVHGEPQLIFETTVRADYEGSDDDE